ncbi:MAG: DUF885 domain-containing protein [Chthoniobacterales bacterium]|nr:DUF885 domain-containing protein [Chthoniobacterales bacterium]
MNASPFTIILLALSLALGPGLIAASESQSSADKNFQEARDKYVLEFLRRNPNIGTQLGAENLDPSLGEIDGALRDHSASALAAEDHWLTTALESLAAIAPENLSPAMRIDRELALAQIRFQLRLHQTRHYQERALDTYTDEPFKGVDLQLQGMRPSSGKTRGTEKEWTLVSHRVAEIPRFLKTAQAQLETGIKSGRTPDFRMLERHGLAATEGFALYFDKTLPELASVQVSEAQKKRILPQLNDNSKKAAAAYREFRAFIAATFFDHDAASNTFKIKPQFGDDRFMLGETEYDWALQNNFKVSKSSVQLYDESLPIIAATRREMIALARQIGAKRKLTLSQADDEAAVRAVLDELSKSYPKSDAEMIENHRKAVHRLVEYSRETGLFVVPADYKVNVVETPEPLRNSISGAAFVWPATFKDNGVGSFYVRPTGNDPSQLREENVHAVADVAAHEGFPGHDFHSKITKQYRREISPVRWLTPGSNDDSSSMWGDAMAGEGWALYAEALMAEPQPHHPEGFYTSEERLYMLQSKLLRDLRVRVDIGIHTGKLKYNEAVDFISASLDFLPGSCQNAAAAADERKKVSCASAGAAVLRYSKSPTQAISYRLGKDEILTLRRESKELLGDRFSLQAFHLLFMKQGLIPAGYFKDEFLREIQAIARP